MKWDELMFFAGLTSLFLLIPVLAGTAAASFFYGKEPWSKRQYKIMGCLYLAVASLFFIMLTSAASAAGSVNPLIGLGVVLFFAFFSHRNFYKAHKAQKK